MIRLAVLSLAAAAAFASATQARDVVLVARLDASGMPTEQHSLNCIMSNGCVFTFDAAADDWRHPASLELRSQGSVFHVVVRSDGAPDDTMLVAAAAARLDATGGLTTTVRPMPPATGRSAVPAWLAGDRPAQGFGPFMIAIQHMPDIATR